MKKTDAEILELTNAVEAAFKKEEHARKEVNEADEAVDAARNRYIEAGRQTVMAHRDLRDALLERAGGTPRPRAVVTVDPGEVCDACPH